MSKRLVKNRYSCFVVFLNTKTATHRLQREHLGNALSHFLLWALQREQACLVALVDFWVLIVHCTESEEIEVRISSIDGCGVETGGLGKDLDLIQGLRMQVRASAEHMRNLRTTDKIGSQSTR